MEEIDNKPVYLRGGYQELLLGSERLVTPLEWANTRQTFQGVHGLWSNGKLDVDVFWVQPVIPDNVAFPSIDHNQNFYGAWGTYHPNNKQWVDLYWLFLDDSDHVTTKGITQDPTSVHTLGTRWTGEEKGFLWDFEPIARSTVGLRRQRTNPRRLCAVTAGLGYSAEKLPMQNPTVWAYYDWASGDHSPSTGNYSTFNQLLRVRTLLLGLYGSDRPREHPRLEHAGLPLSHQVDLVQFAVPRPQSRQRDALYNPAGSNECSVASA